MIPSQVFSAYPIEDFRAHEAGIRDAMDRVLTGSSYILGPEVSAFESEFADWIGARHAVGVANGTDAIELLLRAHGIGPGDQVAVPSHTAVASVSAIQRAGADPVLVDIDPVSRTIDASTLGAALAREDARNVKAVLAVHLYGHPAPLAPLQALCRTNGLLLLEDCAQAHGAEWEGRRVGALADGGAFSFYPTKNLGAIGDGGAVCTNDDGIAERLRWLRQYGWAERYVSHVTGINSRLDELQAALLRVKLRTLDQQLKRRSALARRYEARLGSVGWLQLPAVSENVRHAWHLYVIRTPHREALFAHLSSAGIPVALHYPAAVHQQPAYCQLPPGSPGLPQTESLLREILTLPLHPYLSDEAIDRVCKSVLSFPLP